MPRPKRRIGRHRRKQPKVPRAPVTGPCVLYKLPEEIREQIFSMMLDLKVRLRWKGKTPPLLIALRQKPDLYHEAFRVFRKKNIFTFQDALSIVFKKPENFGRMGLNAIRMIERLELTYDTEDCHPLGFTLNQHLPIWSDHWDAARNWTMNLRSLRLNFCELSEELCSGRAGIPFTNPHLFPKLNRLRVFGNCWGKSDDTYDEFVAYMDGALQVKAEYTWDIIQSDALWQAPKGETFASWMSDASAIGMLEICYGDSEKILHTD